MAISKVLTVLKEYNGTSHGINGLLQSITLSATVNGTDRSNELSVVLVKLVSGAIVEQSTYSAGAKAATKITDLSTGLSAYVLEDIYKVYAVQNPCCTGDAVVCAAPGTFEASVENDEPFISWTGAANRKWHYHITGTGDFDISGNIIDENRLNVNAIPNGSYVMAVYGICGNDASETVLVNFTMLDGVPGIV